jgi:hypothetical protein
MAKGKGSAAPSNAALAVKIQQADAAASQARARAAAASARADLVRANVEAKGKAVTFDYGPDMRGPGKLKVVDVKR